MPPPERTPSERTPSEPKPPEAARLSYVSIFTRDVAALPDFYIAMFGLREIETSRSDRYRELAMGAVTLGFPYVDAYAMLDMSDQGQPSGVRSMLTFAVSSLTEVEALSSQAAALGGRLVKPAFETGFGQVLCVVLDPEGNALRISSPAP
jgi:predicted enzyme related to lactoylglutathione lyase